MKTYYYFIFAGILIILSFFVGRCTTEVTPKITYVKGDTVHDSIPYEKLVPYIVEIPAKPQLPMKPDTIRIPGKPDIQYMKVDTAAIIADYVKKNSYTNTLFDNKTEGKLIVATTVQYNKLIDLGYTFTPMYKEITTQKKRVITPFLSTSYNTLGYFGGGGGLYYHNIGIGVKYITNFDKKGTEFNLNYKF